MNPTDRGGSLLRARALALVNRQAPDGRSGVADALQRLCHAVTLDFDLAGATVTLVPDVNSHSLVAASSLAIKRTEEQQFDAGEGPTRDAYLSGRAVIAPELSSRVASWPGYAPAALQAGVSAVFSLPLQVGATRFGALTLYWHHPRRPSNGNLRIALVFAELATEFLIDDSHPGGDSVLDPLLLLALETHGHIYQAQGMVMVDLGVGLPEALARMRAQAYAADQTLSTLASLIIDGKTVMGRDPK